MVPSAFKPAYQMQRFIDLKRSKGNYFRDVDGNVVLDLHCNYGGLPLGYNHDVFVNVNTSDELCAGETHRALRQVRGEQG